MSPSTATPDNVVAALAAVIREMPSIGKDQKMSQPGSPQYNYRGIEQMTGALQPLFGRYGIVPVPSVVERHLQEIQINSRPWTVDTLHVSYRIYGPGGREDFIEAGPFVGIARDNSDKGSNKAMTQAYKQMLLQVLCISDSKDDPDTYGAEDRDPVQAGPVLVPHAHAKSSLVGRASAAGLPVDDAKAVAAEVWGDRGAKSIGEDELSNLLLDVTDLVANRSAAVPA